VAIGNGIEEQSVSFGCAEEVRWVGMKAVDSTSQGEDEELAFE
jgi:hypothetical protein